MRHNKNLRVWGLFALFIIIEALASNYLGSLWHGIILGVITMSLILFYEDLIKYHL